MTNLSKEEALAKIKEEYKKSLNEKVGYEDDAIFLLSSEEYEKYKSQIPYLSNWWWLRSPSSDQYTAADVDYLGSVYYFGHYVYCDYVCVRPALKYSNLQISKSKKGDDYFMFGEIRWKIIDKNVKIAISELPINFQRFDRYSNDYATSEVRGRLLNWLEQVKNED